MRIIGGVWRSRLLRFPDLPGLRPSPDRVRETLFNWLGQRLDGLACLDAFAGSGALGFEAASRGAARVVMLERDPRAFEALRRNADELGTVPSLLTPPPVGEGNIESRCATGPEIEIVRADALAFMEATGERFDTIFLDPPYDAGLLEEALRRAATCLRTGGRIYAEGPVDPDCAGLAIARRGRSGLSHYCLMEPA